MSQAKVDKYKEYKKNRKEELEKEKKAQRRTSLLWRCVAIVLGLGLLVAIGITAFNGIKDRNQARPDYEREELVLQDVAGIFETTEEATTAPETTAAEDASEPAPSEAETTAEAASK